MNKTKTILWCIAGVLVLFLISILGGMAVGLIEHYEQTAVVFFGGLALVTFIFYKTGNIL